MTPGNQPQTYWSCCSSPGCLQLRPMPCFRSFSLSFSPVAWCCTPFLSDLAVEHHTTHIDRFLAIELDSDPWLLDDIQVETCDGQGCVATGNKQRPSETDVPSNLGQQASTIGLPPSQELLAGCSHDRWQPDVSISPGNAPLGFNALDPRVIYVLELQIVIHSGSVDTHRHRDCTQSIGRWG